jgi:hypothetical protein
MTGMTTICTIGRTNTFHKKTLGRYIHCLFRPNLSRREKETGKGDGKRRREKETGKGDGKKGIPRKEE